MSDNPNCSDQERVSKSACLSAALSGLLLAFSFPKPGLSLLAWCAFVPLLKSVDNLSVKNAFRLGAITGLTAYTGIVYWLVIVMNSYGRLPIVVSILLMLVMAAYLAFYLATSIALVRAGELAGIGAGLSFPVVWVGMEYLRSFALTGFPWASLGYSQYKILPLIQIADISGVYGVSFLIVLANVGLFRAYQFFSGNGTLGKRIWTIAAAVGLMIATVAYGFVRLTSPEAGTPLKVALIQGNISQDVKWDPAFQEETVRIYERLTESVAPFGPDLVVWPESATPFFFQKETAYADRVRKLAAGLHAPLVFGSPAYKAEGGSIRFLNSAFLVNADGEIGGRSDKIHLVPFGEYVPLKRLLPFVNKLVEGIGDFAPGTAAVPLDIGKTRIGVLVCFEGIFPELSRAYVNAGARLLVNISNDAWYKRSSAPYQHLSMTVFRAVENRVPLVRATNTGITAIIDSKGHFNGMTQIFREAALTGEVRPGTGGTLYNRFGDFFAVACLALTLLIGVKSVANKEKIWNRSTRCSEKKSHA
ncbi:apolipoprotein N-acyltransferase [Geobacter sp. OR-1]|uniref:apolipoprotein N-acyltransferase n=1 Tax=Geobacter sp. OR-1 TaxID=1266765 RepID=UPI0005442E72|nr:apolipoprotein N-acyltransferase [Geobacter sp. OR-1]GAM08132.1 apolipoprotein N-acyltransferase [Geobacter sp. OR-1]